MTSPQQNNPIIVSGTGMVTVYWSEPHPENPKMTHEAYNGINGHFVIHADGTVHVTSGEDGYVFPGAGHQRVEYKLEGTDQGAAQIPRRIR